MKNLLTLSFVIFLSMTGESYAYIDPGTGTSILHIVMAFFAALGASLIYFWHKVILFIKSILKKENDHD